VDSKQTFMLVVIVLAFSSAMIATPVMAQNLTGGNMTGGNMTGGNMTTAAEGGKVSGFEIQSQTDSDEDYKGGDTTGKDCEMCQTDTS
jgi:hypothetical protein